MRPFDAFGKLATHSGVKITPQLNSDVALGLRSSNISVDVFTPEVPSALDRIRKRNTDKKNEKVK